MDTRVKQVYAPVFFLCLFFFFSCIFSVISIFTVSFDSEGGQRQNVLIWIEVYTFRLWQQNLLKQITMIEKSQYVKGWETY